MSMGQPTGGHGHVTHGEEASKLKQRFDWLRSFTDTELGEIVFLREGDSMHSGEEYFDISNPERGVFHSSDGQMADESSRYVPKSEVPDNVWQKLTKSYK